MISPQMFEEFVVPDLAGVCRRLGRVFYHLDGVGQLPHLDALLNMPELAGIQWVPGEGSPPPEEWMDVLKRIRDGGKLCQLYVSPEGARRIVQELGGRGFIFAMAANPSARLGKTGFTAEEARDVQKMLAENDRDRRKRVAAGPKAKRKPARKTR